MLPLPYLFNAGVNHSWVSLESMPEPSRILPRYLFETRFRIRLNEDGDGRVLGGWSRDISESGIGGFVAEELELGKIVTLEIPVSKGERVTTAARVVRRLGTEYGFQFIALSANQRVILRRAMTGPPLTVPPQA